MNRPHVLRDAHRLSDMQPPILSLDYEYSIRTGDPTIVGVSDAHQTVSTTQEEGHPHILQLLSQYPDAKWLGHNFTGAESEVFRRLGVCIRPEQIIDTIALHYLLNMHLCKAQKKSSDEDGDVRGRGFMNLFAMCSLYTDCDQWKDCVGEEQCLEERRPCPEHSPFQYNGVDTYWPLIAYPKMAHAAKMRGVDRLYPLHRDLLLELQRVKERGVLVDVPYVNTLRSDFESARAELRAGFTFNPNSTQQVVRYFKEKGVLLDDSKEETIREAVDSTVDEGASDASSGSETGAEGVGTTLAGLLEYKELGKGPDRWFAPRSFNYEKGNWEGYVDGNGTIHCNLGIFTSTGRFNCTGPNLQNVAKRRKDRKTGESLGKRVRRAIISPPGFLLYRADYKNAENVVFLTLAGYHDLPETDFHSYMRDMIGIQETDPFAVALGGARDAAKSVTHATDYFEGIKLLPKHDLRKPSIQREISAGARIVFPDWTVFDKVVTFTGINLANRAFGDSSFTNRKRALDVQMKYFAGFPKLRDLQKRITSQVERERCVRPPTGYCLLSYGHEEDRLKTAAAMWGSNPVAHFTKYAILRAAQHPKLVGALVLQVHDEFIWYADCRHDPKDVARWIREVMCFPLPEIPEMSLRVDVSVGLPTEKTNFKSTWADQTPIE